MCGSLGTRGGVLGPNVGTGSRRGKSEKRDRRFSLRGVGDLPSMEESYVIYDPGGGTFVDNERGHCNAGGIEPVSPAVLTPLYKLYMVTEIRLGLYSGIEGGR